MAELPKFNLDEKPQSTPETLELCGTMRGKGMKHRHFKMTGDASCNRKNHWRVAMSEAATGGGMIPSIF